MGVEATRSLPPPLLSSAVARNMLRVTLSLCVCAWAGRRLAARIPLCIFEPLVIATTIVATVPLLL